MKKLFLGLALAGSLFSYAQEKETKTTSASPVTFGVKGGFNATTITKADDYDNDQKLKAGFHAGVFVNIPIAEKFSIQPELLFSQLGSKSEESYKYHSGNSGFKQEYDFKLNLNYLTMPVMVQYNILPQLYVEAGPEFGVLLGGKFKGDKTLTATEGSVTTVTTEKYSEKVNKDFYNTFNFGIGIGAGYYFTDNFGVTARFTAGITDVSKINKGDAVRNNAFQVGVAYKFK